MLLEEVVHGEQRAIKLRYNNIANDVFLEARGAARVQDEDFFRERVALSTLLDKELAIYAHDWQAASQHFSDLGLELQRTEAGLLIVLGAW